MKLNRLASVIYRGTFLMDPRYAMGMMPMVAKFLNGETVSFVESDEKDNDPTLETYCISPEGSVISSKVSEGGNLYQDAPVGSIMIINISGTILKDDNCGAPGTDTMSGWIKEAIYSDNIAAIVLKINSGGGSVEGTGEFASVVKWADQFKPVIGYTDGLMASAAYWIGSACRRIFASYETVEIGSIGTAIKFYDNRKALELYGYKEHYINADASVDKNQDYYKALDGDYGPIKMHVLNPTNDVFLINVRANREGVLVETQSKEGDITRIEPLSGNVYLAKKAIECGLIDEIGSFDQVCEYALLESGPRNESSNSLKSNNMFFGKFSKLSALAGKAAEGVTAEDVLGVNEQIVASKIAGVTLVLDTDLERYSNAGEGAGTASADLITANTKITGLESQVQILTTAQTAAADALTAAEKERDDWKAAAIEYGATAADIPTGGKQTKKDVIQDTDSDSVDANYSEADAELAQIKANQKQLPK